MATKSTRKPKPTASAKSGASKIAKVKVLDSRVTYRGPMFHVTAQQIVEPSGNEVRRDIVHHRGSVVIMALDESGKEPRILLARQYRYAAQQEMWEFPAGGKDEGEDDLTAAKRELAEETGYSAREWKRALYFYVSPGFLDETMAVFLARDLVKGKARPEEDEVISLKFVSVTSAVKLVMDGKIQDAKTISGVLWLAQKYQIPNRTK
jgi:ADP-ribose pyrophosphatase